MFSFVNGVLKFLLYLISAGASSLWCDKSLFNIVEPDGNVTFVVVLSTKHPVKVYLKG